MMNIGDYTYSIFSWRSDSFSTSTSTQYPASRRMGVWQGVLGHQPCKGWEVSREIREVEAIGIMFLVIIVSRDHLCDQSRILCLLLGLSRVESENGLLPTTVLLLHLFEDGVKGQEFVLAILSGLDYIVPRLRNRREFCRSSFTVTKWRFQCPECAWSSLRVW
jgi:hypothetical protein